MKINYKEKYVFTAKNPKIRFADDIARKVNDCYPIISSTKLLGLNNADKFEKNISKIDAKISKLRAEKVFRMYMANNFAGKVKGLVSSIKNFGVGNCSELTQLAEITARANGLEDVMYAVIHSTNGQSVDHAILYVKDKKTPYIIDAWLGFADYIPNAIKRYQKDFPQYFPIDISDEKKLIFDFGNFMTEKMFTLFEDKKNNKLLSEMFPQLVIKKGSK